MDELKEKTTRSGSKPQLSLSIPKPLIVMVKTGITDILLKLKEYGVENQSHLFRLVILHSEIEDGKLIVDLTKAQTVK